MSKSRSGRGVNGGQESGNSSLAAASRPLGPWQSLGGYSIAVASVLLALGAALLLAPTFNDAPVPLFLAAVTISAWSGGLGPGLVATVLAGVALDRFFDLARGSPTVGWEDTAFDVGLFLAVALLNSALHARLRALNQRIEAARAEAEAAVRAREQVLAVVAHDLKSPLSGISMSAQLAERLLARTDRDERQRVRDRLRDIEGGARRMVGLIDDLLDVAHLRAGQVLQLNTAPTRLLKLVEQAIQRHQLDSNRHTVRLVASADPAGVWDATRLGRVLDNLLSNAIKYSPGGGEITVEVMLEDDEVGRQCAVVRVCDPGIGIPPEDLGRIFSSFVRGRNVGQIPGTGLGLAGARQIVEQHGGSLGVESREGAGSTFSLRLPLGAESETESPLSHSLGGANPRT
jgi:signal transduction histidine kinase